jgi:hypothetical protein
MLCACTQCDHPVVLSASSVYDRAHSTLTCARKQGASQFWIDNFGVSDVAEVDDVLAVSVRRACDMRVRECVYFVC